MGYRSDVAAYFYVSIHNKSPERADKARALLDLWWAGVQADGGLEAHSMKNDVTVDEHGVLFQFNDIKWYDGYKDVERFNRLATQFCEDFIANDELDGGSGINKLFCYEFARIGEELDDNEYTTEGYNVDFRLGINRSIEIN